MSNFSPQLVQNLGNFEKVYLKLGCSCGYCVGFLMATGPFGPPNEALALLPAPSDCLLCR